MGKLSRKGRNVYDTLKGDAGQYGLVELLVVVIVVILLVWLIFGLVGR